MQKRKTNILLIRNSWGFGGAENYPLNLSTSLQKYGYRPLVITRVPELIAKCQNRHIDYKKGLWNRRQNWTRTYYLVGPIVTLWYIYIIFRYKINIVHPQGRDDFIFATQAAWLCRKPIVWTDHGDLKYIMKKETPKRLRRLILKNANRTSAVIAVSNSEHAEILAACPEFPKLQTIYNGVFIPTDINPIKRSKDSLVIVSTSRLIDSKGIRELLEGFSKIQVDLRKNAVLWLVGTGNDEIEYEKIVKKLGIKDLVIFWGFQENVADFLESADIFIHPSYHEAFSLSIIEACMAGLPVVATNAGGNGEIVDDSNGILVRPRDPGAITQALNHLLMDRSKRILLGNNSGQKARSSFNFDKIVRDQVIKIYEAAQK